MKIHVCRLATPVTYIELNNRLSRSKQRAGMEKEDEQQVNGLFVRAGFSAYLVKEAGGHCTILGHRDGGSVSVCVIERGKARIVAVDLSSLQPAALDSGDL